MCINYDARYYQSDILDNVQTVTVHPYHDHMNHLLPGSAVLQHPSAAPGAFMIHYPFSDSISVDSASSMGLPVPEYVNEW